MEDGGLDGLTISNLAQRSGASNGSIYHHFASRAGVVAALYRESFSSCIAELATVLDDRPAAQVVPDLASRYLQWVLPTPHGRASSTQPPSMLPWLIARR